MIDTADNGLFNVASLRRRIAYTNEKGLRLEKQFEKFQIPLTLGRDIVAVGKLSAFSLAAIVCLALGILVEILEDRHLKFADIRPLFLSENGPSPSIIQISAIVFLLYFL